MYFYSDEPRDCNQPVYEIPPSKYSADRILRILLNPKIPDHKVCRVKPSGIKSSGTFVVDARNLKCLDDIKKDEFGMWDYSGSHPQAYKVYHKDCGYMSIEKCGNGATGHNVLYLRRLHCTHPSNPEFKRLICFVTGEVDFFTFTYCMYNCCVHTMHNCCVLTCMID